MAGKYLGPAFDIHGGGLDLRFPHHENELAQSRAAGRPFASYWMHNAWITTAGEKMSKSLGNSLTIPAVLQRFRGIELRFYLVSAHYRSHVEFSFEALEEAAAGFRRIESFLERAVDAVGPEDAGIGAELPETFVAAMDDDLGTPAAVAVLYDTVREGNRLIAGLPAGTAGTDVDALQALLGSVVLMLDVLGLNPNDGVWGTADGTEDRLTGVVDTLVRGLLDQRAAARAAKDWAAADAVRDQLKAAGVEITDTPEGPKWSIA
jgi:cysteinyl-tRNA synthetase